MDTLFRCRLNNVDHYQATPIPEFDPPLPRPTDRSTGKEAHKVSVIRVFGATESGQKVLLHCHGCFQYTFIEYSGSLLPQDVEIAIKTLQMSIDHALAISYRQNPYDAKARYVAHISLVKGVPFYGYHVGYKFYLKVYLLNPLNMTRLADLLREGAVMKRVLQPYEAHMQYIAQWMCDYSLYGCAYLDCAKVKFRSPVPDYLEVGQTLRPWHDQSIPPEMISDEVYLPKQSHCALEVDVRVEDIVNRRSVLPRDLHHDFIERMNPLPIDKKLVQSMAGLWKDETRRRKMRMGLKDPNSTPFPAEVLISMSADHRNIDAGGWIHEEEFREKIAHVAQQEHDNSDQQKLSFDTFVKPVAYESSVQTALDSVEDLYSYNIEKLLAREASTNAAAPVSTQAVVDENLIRGATTTDRDSGSGSEIETKPTAIGKTQNQDSSSGSSASEIKTPLSSGEFASLGIRKDGDLSNLKEDDFLIPNELLAAEKPKRSSLKRARFDESISRQKKRPRFEDVVNSDMDEDQERRQALEDGDAQAGLEEQALEVLDPAFEQTTDDEIPRQVQTQSRPPEKSSQPVRLSQNSTLRFTVVKNPADPNTIKRLSQQSSSPEKKVPSSSVYTPIKPQATSQVTPTRGLTGSATRKLPPPLVLGKPLNFRGLPRSVDPSKVHIFAIRPPVSRHVIKTMWDEGLPDIIYQQAYYSNEDDVPERNREYAGKEFKLESSTVPYLPDFDPTSTSLATQGKRPPVLIDTAAEDLVDRQRRQRCGYQKWNIATSPPTRKTVEQYFANKNQAKAIANRGPATPARKKALSQIDAATQANKHGFKYSQKQESTSVQHETQYMSVMSLEVHVNTRGSLAPNPEEDQIACVFWCIQTDDEDIPVNTNSPGMHAGILALAEERPMAKQISQILPIEVEEEQSELELLTRMVDIVRYYDPDILTGYEVHNSSWGYLIERARLKYDINLCDEISRLKSLSHGRFGRDEDRWGFNHTSTIRVTGRHTINIWRAMRSELNLLQYTMENVAFHLLHKRIPHYSFADLTKWYKSKNTRDLSKVIDYFATRVQIDLSILEANELVPRTSEQARLIGVDWFAVISRGSQFKVENIMFRIAKPENFMLVSPSRRQVGGQNALECLPLVMEPQSDFYTSPMLVLDFQSLYPSVMIAYNYCYSTFLGRVVNWRGTNKMGFTNYQRQERLIELLRDHINIAPNGIMYAKQKIRRSLLAKMLSEILETRVMVKSGMKADKDDKTLQRLLNNRQLALKLIANVTYGYTSASFSGRMPCSEIADSIVQTGRETLEKAIALIHSVSRWGAEVVYGDTDSLFVYLKGRTREQAFKIGDEIAKTITDMNPRPIKLKFEKVYQPCVLLAKKRYVGLKYESPKQTEPEFEAKGIETVRRDGTPAEQKIEENALKVLFRTADLSQVKAFFQAQCAKIMRGKISIQDFCFAKEVKLGTYSDKGPPPPGALISARRMLEDPRQEPQYGERVPYVVVTGGPGARLIDRCVAPDVLLNDAQQELDAEYYISKNLIPPLERIFNLVGANVRQWYDEMPKYQRIRQVDVSGHEIVENSLVKRSTLESYMKASNCAVCRDPIESELPLCQSCLSQPAQSLLVLRAKLTRSEKKKSELNRICRSCSGFTWSEEIRCDSKDCPVFYARVRQGASLGNTAAQLRPVTKDLEDEVGNGIEW
ncbi:DNA polymerase zeta [Knufia obscura]|uniref:DNA polymerase n=2 Tax=Knufia TaxID=430999 RepID=A0AAN8FDJ8_9EURO|nr:DNA polymerase zeta [Knufia obscura]KAK5956381.1 DNA polymerase zeta [Knufia fluminis]